VSVPSVPTQTDDPDPYGDEASFGGGRLIPRGRRLPPIVSAALIVGILVLVAGLGFGYRLEQQSVAPTAAPPVPPVATDQPPETATPPPIDLQANGVSDRLQLAYGAEAIQWAVCGLGTSIACHAINRSLSVSPYVPFTDSFTNDDWMNLGPPPIQPGHLALAAPLGEGTVTGSLILLDAPTDKTRSRPLVPIDPGRAGVYYFDLGPLAAGRYAIVIGVIGRTVDISSAEALQTYLSGFVVTA
jgi:hypothetical protein